MPTYHEGEIAVQESAGVREAAARLEAAIADTIPERARGFVATFGAVAVSAMSGDDRIWTSLWIGSAGFLDCSANGDVVTVSRQMSETSPDDPMNAYCKPGGDVGMLAIDFATRRRLRINGTIAALDEHVLAVDVRESFVNCPKYIQRRVGAPNGPLPSEAATRRGESLARDCIELVERADTTFIATMHPARGLDVSHRGGEPGFIQALNERTLAFADYRGNNMFTTLGNLAVSPRAGFAVVDFDSARILSMTGTARFSSAPAAADVVETGRVCTFSVESWIEFSMRGASSWLLLERSPFNPPPFTTTLRGRD